MVCATNISTNRKKAYYLYIGSFKHHETADHLKKILKKYYKKEAEPLYIFNNFPPSYFKGQYAVINSQLKKHIKKKKCKCRLETPSTNLNKEVSKSQFVIKLINNILKHQKDLYIKAFKDSPQLTLHRRFNKVKLIGPDTSAYATYDNKLFQKELADTLGIPQPTWFLTHNKEDLISTYSEQFKGKPVFVSKLYGFGGSGSAMVKNKKELINHPHINRQHCNYLLCKKIDARDSPCGEGIVANDQEVFYIGACDQILEGPTYLGTVYPSKLKKEILKKIEKYTIKIGKYLGRHGYRGFFGVDYITDKRGKLYFSEINPRTSGSTTDKVCMHELTKRKNMPSLPELEFIATTQQTFGKIKTKKTKPAKFSWGVLNIYATKGSTTLEEIPQSMLEKEAFKKKGTTVLDYPGEDVLYCNNGRLCRIIAVKKTRKEVLKALKEQEKFVLKKIKK